MLINIVLIIGVLAVIASWVVAVRILATDKFADTVTAQTPADSDRRDAVLANTTL